jgi:choline dehydrogenase-like flavoprotein
MLDYNHTAGYVPVAAVEARPENKVDLADEVDANGLRIPRVTFAYSENDRRVQRHALRFMGEMLKAAGGRDLWTSGDTSHLMGTCRMGSDPETSVVDADGRTWDISNLWICDGSLFVTSGAVNPSLTIQALCAARRRSHRGARCPGRALRPPPQPPATRSQAAPKGEPHEQVIAAGRRRHRRRCRRGPRDRAQIRPRGLARGAAVA